MAPRKKKTEAPEAEVQAEPVAAVNPRNTPNVATKGTTMSDKNSIIDLDMNLEDFEDFEILPDGEYEGECTVAELRTSDRGNQYYYTMWKIDPSNYPADYDPSNNPEGTILNYSRVQAPTAGDRRSITTVKRLLTSMGISLKTSSINPSDWVGKHAKLIVGHEEYNGETRNNIKGIESLDA